MTKHISLMEVLGERRAEEARDVRRTLFESCRTVLADLGDDVSGFAVVVWTREGELRSALDTGYGPIRPALIPTLAGDALNRHVAGTLAPAESAKR